MLVAARRVATEDEAAELSRLGADWLLARIEPPRLRVLTHCNTGSLATSAWAPPSASSVSCTPATARTGSTPTRPARCSRASVDRVRAGGRRHSAPGATVPPPRRSCGSASSGPTDRRQRRRREQDRHPGGGARLSRRRHPVRGRGAVVDGRPVDGRRLTHRDRGRPGEEVTALAGGAPLGTRGVAGLQPGVRRHGGAPGSMPSRPSVERPNLAQAPICGPSPEADAAFLCALGVAGPTRSPLLHLRQMTG